MSSSTSPPRRPPRSRRRSNSFRTGRHRRRRPGRGVGDRVARVLARHGGDARRSASSARLASTRRHTVRRSTCWRRGRYPFADLPRRCVGSTALPICSPRWRASRDDVPPVHGVVTPVTEARVPRLPLEEAKAAADQAGIPDYMAELSIFQVLLNHPTLARALQRPARDDALARRARPRLRELVIMRHRLADRMRLRVDPALAGAPAGWACRPRTCSRVPGLVQHMTDSVSARACSRHTDEVRARRCGERAHVGGVRTGARRGFRTVLIELVTAIGAWRMIASILHSLEVPARGRCLQLAAGG